MFTQWAIVAALLFLAGIGAGLTTVNAVGSAAYVLGVVMVVLLPTIAYFVLKYVYRESPSFRTFIDTAWYYRRFVTWKTVGILLLGSVLWAVTCALLSVPLDLPWWRGMAAIVVSLFSSQCYFKFRELCASADRA